MVRDIYPDIERWFLEGKRVALACVTKTWGSSPRVPGSLMAVTDDGRIAGSVSGGCIEGDVAQCAMACLFDGSASYQKYHASTKKAREVGLSCGGNIEVVIAPYSPGLFEVEKSLLALDREYTRVVALGDTDEEFESALGGKRGATFLVTSSNDFESALLQAERGDTKHREYPDSKYLVASSSDIENALSQVEQDGVIPGMYREDAEDHGLHIIDVLSNKSFCAIVLEDDLTHGRLTEEEVRATAQAVLELPRTEPTSLFTLESSSGTENPFFASRHFCKPQLICIGGVHIAIHLCTLAQTLGYRTVVIDPRSVFATNERFPSVDELIHEWPQQAFNHLPITPQTAVCALTHDPKIDVPALEIALRSPAFYIGSLGRNTTQLSRYNQLRELGYSDDLIARIYGPIGLDLRGREPSEIALSIIAEITAEITAVRYGSPYPMTTMVETVRKLMN